MRLFRLFQSTCGLEIQLVQFFEFFMSSNLVFAFSNRVFKNINQIFCSFCENSNIIFECIPTFWRISVELCNLRPSRLLTGVKFAIYRIFSISPLSFSIFKIEFLGFQIVSSKLSFYQNALK